jgi:hypothetical protein
MHFESGILSLHQIQILLQVLLLSTISPILTTLTSCMPLDIMLPHSSCWQDLHSFLCSSLLITTTQQQQEHNENSIEDAVVAKVVKVVCKVHWWLERGGGGAGAGESDEADNLLPKCGHSSHFQHHRARLTIQEDYFSPTPIFDDKQFERVFWVT